MKYIFLILGIFIVLTAGFSQEFSFLITFDISREDVISNVQVKFLDTDSFLPGNGAGEYFIKLVDPSRNIIYETPIWISFARIGIVPNEENGGVEELNSISFWARIPYHKDAQLMQFWHGETQLLEVNLEEELCTPDEACSVFCEDKGIDIDCTSNVLEEPQNSSEFSIPWWIYVLFGIVVLGAAIVFLSVKKA